MSCVLSRDEMRAFDARAVREGHVPGLVLMENAGRGAADILERAILQLPISQASILFVCGTGNNGGDGFVMARHAKIRGANIVVLVVGDAKKIRGDARAHYDMLLGIGVDAHAVQDWNEGGKLGAQVAAADAVVDALFGVGLDRPIDGAHAEVVRTINEGSSLRVALDIPSGLDANTGAFLGETVMADHTITFGAIKRGIMTPNGARASGNVHVADIGVPPPDLSTFGVADPKCNGFAKMIERDEISRLIAPRQKSAHKNSSGHVVLFAGSPGKSGAALLAARGALRAGAGLATIATFERTARALEGAFPEVMLESIDTSQLEAAVDALIGDGKLVVAGPGFGIGEDARRVIHRLLATFTGRMVLDADALTLFAGRPEALIETRASLVLTPHPGEAARLLGIRTPNVEADRYAAVIELAHRASATVVLKGAHTLVANPEGQIAVSPFAVPALATAGSGDTLSGIIGALLCSLDPFDAARLGVYLHGAAGKKWTERIALPEGGAERQRGWAREGPVGRENLSPPKKVGDRGLLASEIADEIPGVIAALRD